MNKKLQQARERIGGRSMPDVRKWTGSAPVCEFCGEWTANQPFVDGKTKAGPWAVMCERCFDDYGVGVGPGAGQRYASDTKEKTDG